MLLLTVMVFTTLTLPLWPAKAVAAAATAAGASPSASMKNRNSRIAGANKYATGAGTHVADMSTAPGSSGVGSGNGGLLATNPALSANGRVATKFMSQHGGNTANAGGLRINAGGGIVSLVGSAQLATNAASKLLPTDQQKMAPPFQLLKHIMSHYSKDTPPETSDNQALVVLARLFPIKVLNLYDKNEALEMTIRLQFNWHDPVLTWDPQQFSNQTFLIVPNEFLWMPDIQVANSASDLYALLRDQKFDFKVHSDGNVWWHPTGNLLTRCELNLMFFPFDFQRCAIILESAVATYEQLNITLRRDKAPVSRAMYVESGNWRLVNVTANSKILWVTKSTGFSRVEFWLHFSRKTSYFKLNVIFPCFMLSSLQLLTFFFPLESHERVPQATSILLSVIVFQSMIVDQLPRSSDSIPLLCVYVALLTCISVISVGESVLIAGLVSRKDRRTAAPKWAHRILKFVYQWNDTNDSPHDTYGLLEALYNINHMGEPKSKRKHHNSMSAKAYHHDHLRAVGSGISANKLRFSSASDNTDDQRSPSQNSLLHLNCLEDQPNYPRMTPNGNVPKLTATTTATGPPLTPTVEESSSSTAADVDSSKKTAISPVLRTAHHFKQQSSTESPRSSLARHGSANYHYVGGGGNNTLRKKNERKKQPPLSFDDQELARRSLQSTVTFSDVQDEQSARPSDDTAARHPHQPTGNGRLRTATTAAAADDQRMSELTTTPALTDGQQQHDAARRSTSSSNGRRHSRRPPLFNVDGDNIYLDWLYLARLIDALMFTITFFVVSVIPIIFFAILPPNE